MAIIRDIIALVTICFAVTGLVLAVSMGVESNSSPTSVEGIGESYLENNGKTQSTQDRKGTSSWSLDKESDIDDLAYPRLRGEITLLDQTDYYQTLGTCRGCTIKTDGCLLVSLTMALDFLEVKVHVPVSQSRSGGSRWGMNPLILNDWFTWQGTYSYNSYVCPGRCLVDWYPLPGNVVASRRMTNRGEYLTVQTKRNIDYALKNNYPVIAGVHWGSRCSSNPSKTEDCHFVLITGKVGSTYRIIDPVGGIETTLDRGALGTYIIDHYRYLK